MTKKTQSKFFKYISDKIADPYPTKDFWGTPTQWGLLLLFTFCTLFALIALFQLSFAWILVLWAWWLICHTCALIFAKKQPKLIDEYAMPYVLQQSALEKGKPERSHFLGAPAGLFCANFFTFFGLFLAFTTAHIINHWLIMLIVAGIFSHLAIVAYARKHPALYEKYIIRYKYLQPLRDKALKAPKKAAAKPTKGAKTTKAKNAKRKK